MITLLIELPVEHCEHLALEHESIPCLMTLDEIVISLETVIIVLLPSYDYLIPSVDETSAALSKFSFEISAKSPTYDDFWRCEVYCDSSINLIIEAADLLV